MAEFRHLVRVVNSDIKGEKPLMYALSQVHGVSIMLANATCRLLNLDPRMKAGELDDKQVAKIEEVLQNPIQSGIPEWMLNRRKDPVTGETSHILSSDIKFTKEQDLRRLKKIKTYIGLRHQWRLPVRGQKTKSNFRRNKGNVKGVQKKKKK